jgi:hypothetical protein
MCKEEEEKENDNDYDDDGCDEDGDWRELASELYRPRDRRLSAKSVPTFAGRRILSPHLFIIKLYRLIN